MKNESKFVDLAKKIWSKRDFPADRFSSIIKIDFKRLLEIFNKNDFNSFEKIVEDLSNGSFLIIQKCFTKKEIEFLKEVGNNLMNSEESSFYKMDRKIPNFWRDITSEHSHKYGVPVVKKSMYFFHWNGEEKLFELINKRWDIIKILGGRESSFGKSTYPEDGFIDRIQLVEYPSGTGYLAPHQDPDHNQRCFISGYMSKIGVDFKSGGFWALNQNNQKVNLEKKIDVGDMGIGSAKIVHGVDQIDTDISSKRWFLGLYTNDSDCVNNRITLEAPKIKI